MLTIKEMYDLEHTSAKDYLENFTYPWEALKGIKDLIIELGSKLDKEEYNEVKEHVWIHKTAKVFESAYIGAPCIIGPEAQIRHCAFIRESALVGAGSVVGNSCELKNVILFDNSEVPHYNYVGDSILGYHAHMGAGSVTSNIKADRKNVIIKDGEQKFETGLRKFGAMIGDFAEIGCNAVLNPGSVVGPHTNVYPTTCFRGFVGANKIVKNDGTIIDKHE